MLSRTTLTRAAAAVGGVAMVAAALAGCSSGGASSDGKVTITFLTQNDDATVKGAKNMIAAFEKKNPKITVKLDTQPAGTDGDNLTKTKLATGEMDDVFNYNTGSLFQVLKPDQTLVNLQDEPWQKTVTDDFKATVKTDKGVYGAPTGTSFGGGVLYNKKVYAQLGLSVPTDWDEFIANSKKIQAAGKTAILQTYGDDWTAQLFVLGDFANVAAKDPKWAANYTANKEKYSDQPAFAGFQHQEEARPFFNKDFASVTNAQGMKLLADGDAVQYPMLSASIGSVFQDQPDKVDDIGFFALPADDAKYTSATIWEPGAWYIPTTTKGDKLTAAKKFVAFLFTPEGCTAQSQTGVPSGPFVTSACKVPDSSPALIKDLQKYFDEKKTSPALEFLSPVKGPGLPAITVQVGSGISTAAQGAKLYDDDVKKQAQQLGLKGW
jgi:raffinose/stachyose/melibiose transport system substrate-binding protein